MIASYVYPYNCPNVQIVLYGSHTLMKQEDGERKEKRNSCVLFPNRSPSKVRKKINKSDKDSVAYVTFCLMATVLGEEKVV